MNNHLEEVFNEEHQDDRIRRYGKPNNIKNAHKCLLIFLVVLSVIFFVVIIYLLYLLNNKNEEISFLEYYLRKFYNENNDLKDLLVEIIQEYNSVCEQLNCLSEQNERLNGQIQDANRMIDSINSRPTTITIHEENHDCIIF